MYIAHTHSGAATTVSRTLRPGRAVRHRVAFKTAILIFACSAVSAFAQSFVSSFDNINGPTFVAIDSNRNIGGTTSTWLYVSEHGNTNNTGGGRILRYNLAAPTTAPVDIGGGHFVSPDGILVDAATGDLIIADRAQDKITRIANTGTVKWTFGSGTAGAADEMHGPCGLAMDATGAIYVTEHGETLSTPAGAGGSFVSKYTVSSTGAAQRQFRVGGTGAGNGQFATTGPYGIAVTSNQLLVSDGFNARVEVFGLDGTYLNQFSIPNTLPLGLYVDASGNLWVAESSGQGDGPIQRVEKMTTAGVSSGVTLTSNTPSLSLPFDAVVDTATNKAYVADYVNHRVAIFDLSASSSGSTSGGSTTGGSTTGGTTTGGTSTGGTTTGGTSTGGTTTGGTSTGGTTTGGTSTGGTSTGGSGSATVAVASVSVPANGTYRAGDALVFKVRFSSAVKIVAGAGHAENADGEDAKSNDDEKSDDNEGSSSDSAALTIGWTAVAAAGQPADSGRAVLVGPIGSTELTFKYQVHGNDRAPQGILLDPSITVPSGVSITDANGHALSAAQLKITWPQNPLTGIILVPANESSHDRDANGGSSGSASNSNSGKGNGKEARFVNLSSRVHVKHGDASHAVVVGFVVSGSGSQPVLVRAIGPSLSGFGITDALSDPSLSVQNSSGQILAANAGWNNDSLVSATASRVGAFGLTAGSHDSAVVLALPPGAYTATIAGGKSDGEALIEVYDALSAGATTAPQLVNMSTRGFVDADGNLIAGFVVQGTSAKRVLVRAVGPGLSSFGVSGALSDPILEVHDASGATVAKNNDWTVPQSLDAAHPAAAAADIAAAAAMAGAFPLASGSKDSAVVITLNPGAYTAVVTGAAHASGAILVEMYELPTP